MITCGPATVTDNLVTLLDWANKRCYQQGNTTFTNLVGTNTGYLKNGATYSNLYPSDHIVMDNFFNPGLQTINDRIDINTRGDGIDRFDKTDSFSFCIWIYTTSSTLSRIVSSGNSGTALDSDGVAIPFVFLDRNSFGWWNEYGSGDNSLTVYYPDLVSLGEWTHVGVTYKYNEGNSNVVRLYKNGILVATNQISTSSHSAASVKTLDSFQWTLGGGHYASNYNASLGCKIGMFWMYNKMLTNEEVYRVYKGHERRFKPNIVQ
jgi:hypothetical protein